MTDVAKLRELLERLERNYERQLVRQAEYLARVLHDESVSPEDGVGIAPLVALVEGYAALAQIEER